MNTTYDIAAQVADVNTLLKNGEPGNISTDNSASYASFTGYKPQAIIDAMNEVFGYGNWGFEEISNEALMGAEKGGLTISQVRVFLKDCAFQPTGWGQARITKGDIGDAKKGAQTDALKKALSYFSIGNRAYHGLLPVLQEGQGQNQQAGRQRNQSQPPQNASGTNKIPTRGNLAMVPQQDAPPEPQSQHSPLIQFMLDARRDGFIIGTTKHERTVSWEAFKLDVLGTLIQDEDLSDTNMVLLRKGLAERKKLASKK